MKRYYQLLIGGLISAFFIYLTVPSLHLEEVVRSMREANYWWVVPGIMVYLGGLWVRTWRWYFLLRPIKAIPVNRLFPLVCIGYFGNNVYPFRAGEVIRSYVLKRQEDVPMTSSLVTVVIERVFDGLVMVLFVFLALPFAPMPQNYRTLIIGLTGLMFLAAAIFVWMAMQPLRVERTYALIADRLLPAPIRQRTDGFYQSFMDGLGSLSSSSDVLTIFFTSVIIWLLETVKYWFVMFAFDFQVSFLVLMLMNGLVNLATTLPSAPGYIGTFDTPGIETLVAFGVNRNIAASYTFSLHAALWLPVTLLGGYYFWRAQLHWSDFSTAQRQLNDAPVVGD